MFHFPARHVDTGGRAVGRFEKVDSRPIEMAGESTIGLDLDKSCLDISHACFRIGGNMLNPASMC